MTSTILQQEFLLQHEHQQQELLYHKQRQEERRLEQQQQQQKQYQEQQYQEQYTQQKKTNEHCYVSSSLRPDGSNNSTTRSQTQHQQLHMEDNTTAISITPKDAKRLLWDNNERLITKLPLKPPSLYGCHTTTTTVVEEEDGANKHDNSHERRNNNNNSSQPHRTLLRPPTKKPTSLTIPTLNYNNNEYDEDNYIDNDPPLQYYESRSNVSGYSSAGSDLENAARRILSSRNSSRKKNTTGSRSWSAERLSGSRSRQYRLSGSDSECSIISGTGSNITNNINGSINDDRGRVQQQQRTSLPTGWRERIHRKTGRNVPKMAKSTATMMAAKKSKDDSSTNKCNSIMTTSSMQHQHEGAVENLIRCSRDDVSSNEVIVKPMSHHPPQQPSRVASMAAAAAQSWSRPVVVLNTNPSPVVTKSSYSNAAVNIISDQTIYNQSGNMDQQQQQQQQQQQPQQRQFITTSPPSSQNTESNESMYHLDDLQTGGIFPTYHRFYSQSLEDNSTTTSIIDRVSDFSPPFPPPPTTNSNGNGIINNDPTIIINQYSDFPRYNNDSMKNYNNNETCEGRRTLCTTTEGGDEVVLPPNDSKQRRSVRFTIPPKNIQHEKGGGGRGGGDQRQGNGESDNNTGDGRQYANKQPHQPQQHHQTQREKYEDNSAGNIRPATENGHGNWEEIQSLTVDWKRAISPERKNYSMMEEFSTLQTSSEMELFAWNDDIRDYHREMSQGSSNNNNNPDSPSTRPLWKVRKDAKNDKQRTLSELQVEYNNAKKQQEELLLSQSPSQSPSLHPKQNFQREQQQHADSAYSRWIDSQLVASSGVVDLPPQVRRMPNTFNVIPSQEELLHARKSRSKMKLDLRSSSREKRRKDDAVVIITPTGKSTDGVECEQPYYFTDGDVPDRVHDKPSGSPSSWKRFGLFRSRSPKCRQYYSDGERFNSDWVSSRNTECGRSKKTTTKKKKKKKKPPTSLVASPPRSLSRLRSPMRMRGQKDNSNNVIADNKEFIVMNDSMSMGRGKHDNVSKIIDMTTGGEMGVETIAQWDEVESQIHEPPIFEDDEPNTPISELTAITNMSIVPSTSGVQSNDYLRDNQMTDAHSKLLSVPHLSVPQTLTNNVNSPRALAATANHADIPRRLMSHYYGTSLLDDTLNTSGYDETRSVVSFDADALGSLDTMATLPSKSMALAASAKSPRSIRSRDAPNAYNSDGNNTTVMELNEIERLRRENEILKEELENVSQLSMKVSKMYTECLKLENVRLRVSKECLISQEVAASESIIHKLDIIAEEIDKTNTVKEGRKKTKKKKQRVRHAPNPTVINEFNNLLPVAHLINGVDFDDDTVTTVSTQGGGYETTPELLKRTCSSIVATTAILASQVKTSLNQQSDASASRPMDCFNHCRRRTGNDNNVAEASIARKKTNMTT
jgi:hypothetical protein